MGFVCGWLGACVVTIYEVCWGGQILSWLVIFYRGLLKGLGGVTFDDPISRHWRDSQLSGGYF